MDGAKRMATWSDLASWLLAWGSCTGQELATGIDEPLTSLFTLISLSHHRLLYHSVPTGQSPFLRDVEES